MGGPARLLVPHPTYTAGSPPWVNALQFTARDEAGSGSCVDYHIYGDPGASNGTPMTEIGATRVLAVLLHRRNRPTDSGIKSFFLRLGNPFAHLAGQHVDVRLTAPDGYTAMRSYSIASSPASSPIPNSPSSAFTMARSHRSSMILQQPATSRTPWTARWPISYGRSPPTSQSLLIGAGSGVVPLMAMIRQRRSLAQSVPVALLPSARTAQDVLFSRELHSMKRTIQHSAWRWRSPARRPCASDFDRRIDGLMVKETISVSAETFAGVRLRLQQLRQHRNGRCALGGLDPQSSRLSVMVVKRSEPPTLIFFNFRFREISMSRFAEPVFVAAGLRTPFGRGSGALANYDAVSLSVPVVQAMANLPSPIWLFGEQSYPTWDGATSLGKFGWTPSSTPASPRFPLS